MSQSILRYLRQVNMLARMALLRFSAVSLIGWVGDFVVFLMLTRYGVAAGTANLVSAALAVTFVYFASVRRIFNYRGHFIVGKFTIYLLYQILAVAAASWLIGMLDQQGGLAPWLSKVVVTPLTFIANYLFMKALTSANLGRL